MLQLSIKTDMRLLLALVLVAVLLVVPLGYAKGQDDEKILTVLDFGTLANHYVSPSFSNYYQIGDTVYLQGISMLTNRWVAIPEIHGIVSVVGPDGKTILQKEIITDDNGKFKFSLPITSDFKMGKYTASVQASSDLYQSVDNEYLTVFYVLRTHDYTIDSAGKQFAVKIGSVDFDTSDMQFDSQKNLITFDLKKAPGNYTSDGNLGYVSGNVFMKIPKSLVQGSFFYKLNGVGPYWTGWFGNETDSEVQITPGEVWPSGTQDVKVSVGTHEMSDEK